MNPRKQQEALCSHATHAAELLPQATYLVGTLVSALSAPQPSGPLNGGRDDDTRDEIAHYIAAFKYGRSRSSTIAALREAILWYELSLLSSASSEIPRIASHPRTDESPMTYS